MEEKCERDKDEKETPSEKKGVWFGEGYPLASYFFVPFTRHFLRPVFRYFYGYRWRGHQHIPATGAFMIAPNHGSFLDPPLTGTAARYRRYRFLSNENYFRHPVLAFIMYVLAVFPVDLKARFDRRAYRLCLETLEEGLGLIIFPEGTRSKDGRLQALQAGPARMALQTGAFIIPTAITGASDVWPKGRKLPFLRGNIRLRMYRPIPVEKLENSREMAARIRELNEQVARPIARRLRAWERWKRVYGRAR